MTYQYRQRATVSFLVARSNRKDFKFKSNMFLSLCFLSVPEGDEASLLLAVLRLESPVVKLLLPLDVLALSAEGMEFLRL